LHVLLFNVGQVSQIPLPSLRSCPLWKDELVPPSTPRAIATPIERWLRLRLQTTDRAESVRHCRDSFRYFPPLARRYLPADYQSRATEAHSPRGFSPAPACPYQPAQRAATQRQNAPHVHRPLAELLPRNQPVGLG
jgi:hypothetical protein